MTGSIPPAQKPPEKPAPTTPPTSTTKPPASSTPTASTTPPAAGAAAGGVEAADAKPAPAGAATTTPPGTTSPPPPGTMSTWPIGPPPPPSAFQRRWPVPVGSAPPLVLAVVTAAAAIGAASIPSGLGVGWLVAALAGTTALGTVAWWYAKGESEASVVRRLGWSRLGWAAATVALVGVGAVRAAGWLFVLCLLTAGVTAGLALVDGRSTRGMLFSLVFPPLAAFRSLPWAVAGLSTPAIRGDGGEDRRPQLGRVLRTAAVSAVLLLIFGALFASADETFARLLGAALPEVSGPGMVRWSFLFGVVGAGLLGAAYLLARPPDVTGSSGTAGRRVRRWEWGVPVALLDGLFLAFVGVQITVLFGGGDHVLRTAGLTYANHARGGFWQLLVVSGLTLLVIAGAARWAPRSTAADRMVIRLLLGALASLSLVVVASALYRMELYTEAYGATRLRLLVFVCELWIGLVFVLVLVAGVRLRAAWLPRIAVASAVLALLGLAVLNPDRWIADRNIARYQDIGRLDIDYLSELSADAAPALDRLPAPLRDCALGIIADHLQTDGIHGGAPDWREANLGLTRARRLLAVAPVRAPSNTACWSLTSPR